MFSGGQDIVALPVSEQIRPYAAIASPQKYFVLMEDASHFSTIGDLPPEDQIIDVAVGGVENSDFAAHEVLKVLGLSFFETTLWARKPGKSDFEPLLFSLSSALNNPAFPLFPLDNSNPSQSSLTLTSGK